MRLAHDPTAVRRLRPPTGEAPWRVLLSGCMAGLACGVDGTDYGFGGRMQWFFDLPGVVAVPFCPEEAGLGVPRGWPDIEGGDGFDVLDGKAAVVDEKVNDLTAGMIEGAEAMVAFARAERVDFAILLDMSAACGTQVISDGTRFKEDRAYRRGLGVAAAALVRAGVPVVSHRDDRTLDRLRLRIETDGAPRKDVEDHHERAWYREYFGSSA